MYYVISSEFAYNASTVSSQKVAYVCTKCASVFADPGNKDDACSGGGLHEAAASPVHSSDDGTQFSTCSACGVLYVKGGVECCEASSKSAHEPTTGAFSLKPVPCSDNSLRVCGRCGAVYSPSMELQKCANSGDFSSTTFGTPVAGSRDPYSEFSGKSVSTISASSGNHSTLDDKCYELK